MTEQEAYGGGAGMSSMRNIRQELDWIIRLMESVSATPGRSNGAVRWRLKLIEDELRTLQRRVRSSRTSHLRQFQA